MIPHASPAAGENILPRRRGRGRRREEVGGELRDGGRRDGMVQGEEKRRDVMEGEKMAGMMVVEGKLKKGLLVAVQMEMKLWKGLAKFVYSNVNVNYISFFLLNELKYKFFYGY